MMELIFLCLPAIFAIVFFLNGVTLLEKLKQGRSIHNEKILGCVCLTVWFNLFCIRSLTSM